MEFRGKMVRANDFDFDFPANSSQISDYSGSGFAEPNLSDFLGTSCDHAEGTQNQLENQAQRSYFDFNSILEEFDKEYGSAENHQNQQPNNMVQNHGGLTMNDLLAPNNFSAINDQVPPLDYIPPIAERDLMMEELLAPYSSTASHDLATPNGHAINYEQQNGALGRGVVDIGHPVLTYCKGGKHRVRWTPALHDCFISAVDQLGGPESATPMGIASLMNIPGLNRRHIKSHLQKYRKTLIETFD